MSPLRFFIVNDSSKSIFPVEKGMPSKLPMNRVPPERIGNSNPDFRWNFSHLTSKVPNGFSPSFIMFRSTSLLTTLLMNWALPPNTLTYE